MKKITLLAIAILLICGTAMAGGRSAPQQAQPPAVRFLARDYFQGDPVVLEEGGIYMEYELQQGYSLFVVFYDNNTRHFRIDIYSDEYSKGFSVDAADEAAGIVADYNLDPLNFESMRGAITDFVSQHFLSPGDTNTLVNIFFRILNQARARGEF